MEIGNKLKEARLSSGLTQEQVAEEIGVSRQSISNWENEKTYPDIINVIHLSDLYEVSLDVLLKGDQDMIKHLDKSTNIVKSNKKLLIAIGINLLLIAVLIVLVTPLSNYILSYIVLAFIFLISGHIFYQLIQRI